MFEGAPDRLRSERSRIGLNQADFGKLAGVSKNTQMAYEAGSSPITLEYLARLANDIDVFFVTSGQRIEDTEAYQNIASNPASHDDVEISEIDLKYGMGATYLDNPITSEKRRFSRGWLRNFTRAAPEQLFWAVGDGDSMEPTIRSGEIILIDGSQTTPRMAEGIWAVALGEFGMVKRIHYAGDGQIQLLSDNSLIPPTNVAEDELHVIGRVVAVVRRL